jgi:DNA-binding GntR family transcriptional regulator
MLRTLQDRYRRLWPMSPKDGTARQIAEEHRAIAEAATSREAARATALLRAHIEATGTELRARMQAHPPATP